MSESEMSPNDETKYRLAFENGVLVREPVVARYKTKRNIGSTVDKDFIGVEDGYYHYIKQRINKHDEIVDCKYRVKKISYKKKTTRKKNVNRKPKRVMNAVLIRKIIKIQSNETNGEILEFINKLLKSKPKICLSD